MMQWTQIKLSAGVAILAIAVGGGAVAISADMISQQPGATTATVAAAPAVEQPEVTSEPEMVRSALQRFMQGIRSHDPEAVERCVVASDDPESQLSKTMLLEVAAWRRLQDLVADKFKQQPTMRNLSFAWISEPNGGVEVLLEKTLQNLDDAEIQINGNEARVPLKFPPAQAGRDNFAGFRGWWLALTRDGPLWKLDLNQTMRVTATIYVAPGKRVTSAAAARQLALTHKQQIVRILSDTAKAVEDGTIKSADHVARRIENEITILNQSEGITGCGYNLQPAAPRTIEAGM